MSSTRAQKSLLRAQVYLFLSNAFLYPCENWSEDLSDIARIIGDLAIQPR